MREVFIRIDTPKSPAEMQDDAIAKAARRYQLSEMTETDFIDFLAELHYLPNTPGDYTDVFTDVPGSFDTVIRLLHDGVINDKTYDTLLEELDKRDASS